eukprot:GHVR01050273.1.p1 GENE.GHVR01050273.1~~GHVR01050273.1.p1  ORF type:complete len:351 (+),score=122.71 GHVR01050273.1:623-1675(+)
MRVSQLDSRLEEERLHLLEQQKHSEILKNAQKHKAHKMQQDQIREKEEQKEEERQVFLLERQQVDEIVQRLVEQEQRECDDRASNARDMRDVSQRFLEDRGLWRQRERQKEQQEVLQMKVHSDKIRDRGNRIMEEKKRIEDEKTRVQAEISRQQLQKDHERAELHFLRNELHQEEMAASIRQREDEVKAKREHDKESMLSAYHHQTQLKVKAKEDEARLQALERRELLDRFAHDERVQEMTRERRRNAIERHKLQVNAILAERVRRADALRQEEIDTQLTRKLEEQRKMGIIEEERLRLLREEAAPLKDFLPKGTLLSESDRDVVVNANKQHILTHTLKPVIYPSYATIQ